MVCRKGDGAGLMGDFRSGGGRVGGVVDGVFDGATAVAVCLHRVDMAASPLRDVRGTVRRKGVKGENALFRSVLRGHRRTEPTAELEKARDGFAALGRGVDVVRQGDGMNFRLVEEVDPPFSRERCDDGDVAVDPPLRKQPDRCDAGSLFCCWADGAGSQDVIPAELETARFGGVGAIPDEENREVAVLRLGDRVADEDFRAVELHEEEKLRNEGAAHGMLRQRRIL